LNESITKREESMGYTAPDGRDFVWGEPLKSYEIGPYKILKYQGRDESKASYHGWINNDDTNSSWGSLDAALVGMIAISREGHNSRAADYFMKMLS
jgi:hypothetical protein